MDTRIKSHRICHTKNEQLQLCAADILVPRKFRDSTYLLNQSPLLWLLFFFSLNELCTEWKYANRFAFTISFALILRTILIQCDCVCWVVIKFTVEIF